MRFSLLVTSAILSIGLCVGCSALQLKESSSAVGSLAVSPSAAALAELPALADLPEVGRSGSVSNVLLLEGDQSMLQGGNTAPVEPSAISLSSTPGLLSFAIFGFALPAETEQLNLVSALMLELGTAGTHYMAIANYDLGRWEYIGIEALSTGPQTLSDNTQRSPAGYLSPGGSVYIAVLAWGGQSLKLDNIALITDLPLLPPTNVATNGLGAQQTYEDRIELSWSPAIGAESYRLFARYVADGPEAVFIEIAQIEGGESDSFVHSAETTPEFIPTFSAQIEYALRSHSAGEDSPLSETAIGMRSIPPPLTVTSVDQAHDDAVYVEWSDAVGAVGYLLYIDDAVEPELFGAATYAWVEFEDFEKHIFHVRSVSGEGEGVSRSSSQGASRIEWTNSSPMLENYSGVNNFALAIVAGRPAVAFHDAQQDGIFYAWPEEDEPNSSADWVLTQVDAASLNERLDLVEHGGLPWIVYDVHELDGVWRLSAAYSDQAEPLADGDWNTYPIAMVLEAQEQIELAEVNGLLRFIDQDQIMVEEELLTETYIYYAAGAAPNDGGDWTRNGLGDEEDPLDSSSFALAEIAGGTAVAYRRGGVHYLWSAATVPGELDWTTSQLPLPLEDSAIGISELQSTPEGEPSILLTYRGEVDVFTEVLLFEGELEVPLGVDDWRVSTTGISSVALTASDSCYFLGRAQVCYLLEDTSFNGAAALHSPPRGAPEGWSNYEIDSVAEGILNLQMLSYNDRPLAVSRRNIADGTYLEFRRVQP